MSKKLKVEPTIEIPAAWVPELMSSIQQMHFLEDEFIPEHARNMRSFKAERKKIMTIQDGLGKLLKNNPATKKLVEKIRKDINGFYIVETRDKEIVKAMKKSFRSVLKD